MEFYMRGAVVIVKIFLAIFLAVSAYDNSSALWQKILVLASATALVVLLAADFHDGRPKDTLQPKSGQ